MSAYEPRVGDRVRVTVEGIVSIADPEGDGNAGGTCLTRLTDPECENVYVAEVYFRYGDWEHVPEPESEWHPGDVALTADGRIIRRSHVATWTCSMSRPGHNVPVYQVSDPGPLKLLVRFGQAVTS